MRTTSAMQGYEYKIPYAGDPVEALDVAKSTLLAQGFEIASLSRGELRAIGPGLNSTNQPALLGASEIILVADSSSILARAQLGGARRMKLFLYSIPAILGVVALALALFGMSWLFLLLPAIWLVLSPVLSSWVESRTKKAIDGLVRSMAAAASRRAPS
jgi:hypothetical protein